jgi:hypothetical protein
MFNPFSLMNQNFVSRKWMSLQFSMSARENQNRAVHSKVKASPKEEAERVGKYMVRPLFSLERLSFSEKEGKVCYRYGKEAEELERMDYAAGPP